MPLDPSQEDFKYWAFISYSHSDEKWAEWLHRSLETYRVPKHLVGKPTREGVVPARAFPVFRDRDELPGSANLGENLEAALRLSRYLIVICSPRAVQSAWVDKEIRMFKSWGREDRVLCLVVEGEPNASAHPEKGLPECLPAAIRFWVDDKGEVTSIPTEPIAADARRGKDGKPNALLKILAGILGVNFADLRQRDHERRERHLKMVLASSFALLVVFSGMGVGFYFQKNEAVLARKAAESERKLAEKSRELAEERAKDAEAARSQEAEAREKERVARERAEAARDAESRARDEAIEARKRAEREQQIAQKERETAEIQRNKAAQKEEEVRKTLSVSDLTTARKLIEENEDGKALAYLARALRYDPGNKAVISRAISLLNQRNWPIPLMAPLKNDGQVKAGSFSSDGKFILTVSGSAAVIWNSATGERVGQPLAHKGKINCAKFSPDGNSIVTASDDGTAQIWSVSGAKVGAALAHQDRVLDASFSPDNKRIATASQDRTARVWDVATGNPLTAPLPHDGPVRVVLFAPEANGLLTCWQNSASLWSLNICQPIGVVMQHEGGVYAAAFSPDGRFVATGSGDKTARLWDAITGLPVSQPMRHEGWVSSVQFSPDGTRLLTASTDTTAQLWDVPTGKNSGIVLKHDEAVNRAVFSPNGRWIATASSDGTAQIWSAISGAKITEPLGHLAAVRDAQFSPDGKSVLTASDDATALRWSVLDSRPISEPFRHQQQVNNAIFSPDGKYLATISADRTARVWNLQTGKPVSEPLRHKKSVISLAFSPDGKFLATGCEDWTAQVWEIASGKALFKDGLLHERSVHTVSFSPDGKLLLAASDDRRVRVWDLAKGAPRFELKHDGEIRFAAFSSDGKWIVTAANDKKARVWNVADGKLIASVTHDGAVLCAAISPDEKWLATGSDDKTARVWDIATGNPITEKIVHNAPVNLISFLPEAAWNKASLGRNWILTASDKNVRIWEADSGRAVTEPMLHEETVKAAAFSPDGDFIVTAAGKTARIWDGGGKLVTEPFRHDGLIRSAGFSPDGNFLVTASADQTARVWFVTLQGESPEWMRDFARAIGGYTLDNLGATERVSDRWEKWTSARDKMNESSRCAQWARWFGEDRATRDISPFVNSSVPEFIQRRLAENSPVALNEILDLQPDHALALAKTARLAQSPENAEFLSRLAQDYQPRNSEILWLRAQVLQQLNRPREALSIMEKAIGLDPRNSVSFGPEGNQFVLSTGDGTLSQGWLPKGWADFSSVPNLNVSYLKLAEVPKAGITGIEMQVLGENSGKNDLRGPRFICRQYRKCVVEGWIRSAKKSDLNVVVTQFIEPFQKYKEQIVRTTPDWKPFKIQFYPMQDIAAELRLMSEVGSSLQLAGVQVRTE